MIKRITRKETLDEVASLIARRADMLVEMSKDAEGDDDDFARQLSMRAWELEMVLQDIERNIR